MARKTARRVARKRKTAAPKSTSSQVSFGGGSVPPPST